MEHNISQNMNGKKLSGENHKIVLERLKAKGRSK